MQQTTLVFRNASQHFYSIENVFNTLFVELNAKKLILPYESSGIINRIKNILFLRKQSLNGFHITGHDHYLLWWPFKNVILTIHDIEALNRKNGLKKWLFKKLWFDWPIKNASLVTTISEFSKTELLKLGQYKTPIQVINNPLTLKLSYSPKEFNENNPRILHLGTKDNKNLERLIDALLGVKCELIIIGKLPSKLKTKLDHSKLDYQLKFSLNNTEVIEEYKKCDFLSFISTYEGFGLPILEAQACGRLVITSNCASMPEVAGDGAMFVDPFSVKSIKLGFQKLIEDKDLRNTYIKNGLENIKHFNPKRIADQYSLIYQRIINGSK